MEPLIVLAVTFGLMWVLFILPRQRQLRAHQRLVAELAVGDDVVTGGGIYGTITELEPEAVRIEVADGVVLRVARAAVLRRVVDEPIAPPAETARDEDPPA
jgi:preprotein translocase subunit YajC